LVDSVAGVVACDPGAETARLPLTGEWTGRSPAVKLWELEMLDLQPDNSFGAVGVGVRAIGGARTGRVAEEVADMGVDDRDGFGLCLGATEVPSEERRLEVWDPDGN